MRLTTMTDYALRLLMYLAQQPDRLCTIAEAAQAHGVSEAHLMKVTHHLGLLGWIETVRGKGGGMRLARDPHEIGLGEVVRDMEPDFHLVECFSSGNTCVRTGDCALTGVLHSALQDFLARLDGVTLADIVPTRPLPATRVAVHRVAVR
ncbi:MAG: Rrf2 family transcriptional regulator [Hydrogenophaga sp.]|uniref:RrF2 family transcriptional regulator n=1 Tax=Hydrogenophaga sp. TaxID=1904254 RepID=UPI0025C52683|nr:Rrf2 family transcriptional regulator [Hydrogenophaga sp.]MBU7574786.1 Rrf2 family transcriptional regulator [Hydrogenophaga sp.]